jgi:hypothetical protein
MKKIAYYFFILWFAFAFCSAGAHAVNDDSRHALHSQLVPEEPAQKQPALTQSLGLYADLLAEANHSDCIYACNGHACAPLALMATYTPTDSHSVVPTFDSTRYKNVIYSDIDRPKWTLTTLAVVNPLS